MKYFFILFLLISGTLQAEHNWVQEKAVFGQVDGKSFVVRINEALKNSQHDEVIDLCDLLLENATKAHNKALAITYKASALNSNGDWKEAFTTYQQYVDLFPMYLKYDDVVSSQLAIADEQYEKIKGRDSIFLDRLPVIKLYKQIINNAPYNDTAPRLLLRVAILQKENDQAEDSVQSYRTIIKRHRTTAEAGYARINLAQHYLNSMEKVDTDQRLIDESKSQLLLFKRQFPKHPMRAEALRRLKEIYNIEAERLYMLAVFYNRKQTPHFRPDASKRYLYQLVLNYGDSSFINQAKLLLKSLDSDFKVHLVKERDKARLEKEKQQAKLMLPPEATDKSKRKTIIKQGDSDKHLLPLKDLGLNLKPLENTEKIKLDDTKNEKK